MVSIKSEQHVLWLKEQAANQGVNLGEPAGVPLGYDPFGNNAKYYDLTDSSRDVTPIFDALRADGWNGDYHTDQSAGCSGSGQPFAGFGWRSENPGIEDWGTCHDFNKILCELK